MHTNNTNIQTCQDRRPWCNIICPFNTKNMARKILKLCHKVSIDGQTDVQHQTIVHPGHTIKMFAEELWQCYVNEKRKKNWPFSHRRHEI